MSQEETISLRKQKKGLALLQPQQATQISKVLMKRSFKLIIFQDPGKYGLCENQWHDSSFIPIEEKNT